MPDKIMQNSNGGQFRSSHAAGTSGSTTALTGAGRLCKINILTVGTASPQIFDGTDNTGAMIWQGKTNPVAGDIYDVQVPVTTGIYVQGLTTASHGICISWSRAGVNGLTA